MAQLADDPVAVETLRALHQPVLKESIPVTLLAATRRSAQSLQQRDQWRRWGGMAASVMLDFGVGWLSRGQLSQLDRTPVAWTLKLPAQAFVQQASVAHAVFSPEVRHPVEVTADQQDHLVQWLSKRLGKPLKVPSLATQGYELVGGRLLPGDSGARAQFMFQNQAGTRVTLYLSAVNGNPAPGAPVPIADTGAAAFRYSADGPVASFYWVDQGFGYALSGAVPRLELMRLAQLVYPQL